MPANAATGTLRPVRSGAWIAARQRREPPGETKKPPAKVVDVGEDDPFQFVVGDAVRCCGHSAPCPAQ
jgi:hypothetical protein